MGFCKYFLKTGLLIYIISIPWAKEVSTPGSSKQKNWRMNIINPIIKAVHITKDIQYLAVDFFASIISINFCKSNVHIHINVCCQ